MRRDAIVLIDLASPNEIVRIGLLGIIVGAVKLATHDNGTGLVAKFADQTCKLRKVVGDMRDGGKLPAHVVVAELDEAMAALGVALRGRMLPAFFVGALAQ